MITRFAPSPTGHLHLGHLYAAKVAFDLAQKGDGQFLVRFEDIDHTRVRPEYYQSILDDLTWLRLTWDGIPWRQLDRLDAYQKALETLKAQDLVYPCTCTRREIEAELKNLAHAPHGPEGPLYPGTCRGKTNPSNIEPAWRLDIEKALNFLQQKSKHPLTFHDDRFGEITADPHQLGDVILARKDIGTSYHLAVVVDDAAQNITHVTRGEDLLTSTHIHRLLQALLDLPLPQFHHHPLVLDENGERLAKRHNALSLKSLHESGLTRAEIFKMAEQNLSSAGS